MSTVMWLLGTWIVLNVPLGLLVAAYIRSRRGPEDYS